MTRCLKIMSLALALLLALASAAFAEAAFEAPAEEWPEMELTDPRIYDASVEALMEAEEAFGAQDEAASGAVDAMAIDESALSGEAEPIRLNATELVLGVKETFRLAPVLPEGMTGVTFGYATSSAKIAPVTQDGLITAKRKGTATITVKASTGEQFTCKVTVMKAPKKITLSATSGTLGFDAASGVGTSYKLGVAFPKGTGAHVAFTGYDASVVAVSDDGVITAKGLGATTVTASTFNGKKAACKVTVLGAPQTLAFNDPAPAMIEREKRTLALTVPEGTCACASFASDNAAVATVNADTGEITAVGQGECTITATAFNGVTASCKLSVLPGPDRIVVPATVLLGLGDTALLGARPVRNDGAATGTGLSYVSSKPKYVQVEADGAITGKKRGSAKVTITAANGVKATCTVKVVKAPGSVRLTADKRMLQFDAAQGIAESAKLKVILPQNTASHIVFSGYDPAVVSVATDGTVTAKGLGTTTITATTFNGKTAGFRISVCAPGQALNRSAVNVAHRGGGGYWPENTLEAFRNVASTGATAVELDARSTKDGVQVVHHDATFTAGGKKYTIKKLTFERLRALDASICTLDEALDALAGTGLEINLELKDSADAAACVKAIKAHGLQDRTLYISFEHKQLRNVRQLDGSARLGYIIRKTPSASSMRARLQGVKVACVFQKDEFLTPEAMYEWQDAGYKVGVWTVNDEAAIRKWLALGVDYITSDYPKLVAEALK